MVAAGCCAAAAAAAAAATATAFCCITAAFCCDCCCCCIADCRAATVTAAGDGWIAVTVGTVMVAVVGGKTEAATEVWRAAPFMAGAGDGEDTAAAMAAAAAAAAAGEAATLLAAATAAACAAAAAAAVPFCITVGSGEADAAGIESIVLQWRFLFYHKWDSPSVTEEEGGGERRVSSVVRRRCRYRCSLCVFAFLLLSVVRTAAGLSQSILHARVFLTRQ